MSHCTQTSLSVSPSALPVFRDYFLYLLSSKVLLGVPQSLIIWFSTTALLCDQSHSSYLSIFTPPSSEDQPLLPHSSSLITVHFTPASLFSSMSFSSSVSFDLLPALLHCTSLLFNPPSEGAPLEVPPHPSRPSCHRLALLPLLLSMPACFSSIADIHADKLIFSMPLSQLWASVPHWLFEPKAYLSV